MRVPTLILAAALVAGGASGAHAQASPKAAPPEVVQYLFASAASDVHAHPPIGTVRFRQVRIGHSLKPDGTPQYLMCGQYAGAPHGGQAVWVPFVTIKMTTYEQYIGTQATSSWCNRPDIAWDSETDLSAGLQAKFDSL